MKKPNYLKGLRVVLAILIFVPILLFFVDFADVLPDNLHTLLHLQIMPAILAGDGGVGSLPIRIGFIVRPDLLLGYLPGGRIARYYQPGFLYRKEEKERSTQVQLS